MSAQELVYLTLREAADRVRQRQVSPVELLDALLARTQALEPQINAYITPMFDQARAAAREAEREITAGQYRGPLHGIPIALKDNFWTRGVRTTAGSKFLADFVPTEDATVVAKLRAAGAIIIAKTQMTELANWVAGPPTPMPGNYNAVNGFGYNPYDPRRDPRDGIYDGRPVMPTGGSSSGIGTSANFWAANVGTETSGSILNPSNWTMLVGILILIGSLMVALRH